MPRNLVVAEADQWEDGMIAPVEFGRRRIALCKVEGTFHAFDDHCPHRGSTLALGTLYANAVECPRHSKVWRVTDGASLMDGEPLNKLKVWVEGNDVVLEVPDAWPEPAHLKRHPKSDELRAKWLQREKEAEANGDE